MYASLTVVVAAERILLLLLLLSSSSASSLLSSSTADVEFPMSSSRPNKKTSSCCALPVWPNRFRKKFRRPYKEVDDDDDPGIVGERSWYVHGC